MPGYKRTPGRIFLHFGGYPSMKELFCYKITFDHYDDLLTGRPRYYYIIAENMEKACELANSKRYFQHEIKDCQLMGAAITPETPKFN